MSEQKWTPEPWHVQEFGGDDPYFCLLRGSWDVLEWRPTIAHNMHSAVRLETERANAARIVACVNGCAGINPDAVQDLLAACKAYEQWEADLVLCSEAWSTGDGLPRMTQELYDRFMEIQALRNVAISKAEKGTQ